ncbi:MAG: M20 family metallo-hydrolase [Spirochaetes bacterium]|nr:M20 family metallo-hydrolase [Spirochaetota bacterium]
MRNAHETKSTRLKSMNADVIAYERELVRRPALAPENGGTGEHDKAAYIITTLKKEALTFRDYPVKDARVPKGYRPNFCFIRPGIDTTRTFWIIAHMDVVPEGDRSLWKSDPFKLRVKKDTLIGRGVLDNNFAIVAGMLFLKTIARDTTPPPVNAGVFFFADEEVGSRYGIEGVLKRYKNVFGRNDIVYVPDMGSPDGAMMEVAEKSMVWMTMTVRGKQAHGSLPNHGRNAHRAAAYLVTAMDAMRAAKFGERDAMFDHPFTSVEPTRVKNNVTNINTIPGEQVISFDCRLLPQHSIASFMKAVTAVQRSVAKKFGITITRTIQQQHSSLPPLPVDSTALTLMRGAVKDVFSKKMQVYGVGGGTCAYFLRERGINAVVCGKGKETAHAPNESVAIRDITDYSKLFLNALKRLS